MSIHPLTAETVPGDVHLFIRGGFHMGTFLVGAVLAGIVALIIRSMIRDKKNGKSIQCGGDCRHCKGHCTENGADH